jgi:hypothetical protein
MKQSDKVDTIKNQEAVLEPISDQEADQVTGGGKYMRINNPKNGYAQPNIRKI